MKYKKNSDGTDMLDENGNPIPEENTNGQGDETITPEEVKRLKDAEASLLKEVTDLRKKNRELSEKKEPVVPPNPNDLEQVVKKVLTEEKMANVKSMKDKTFERFIIENKEFHPDNDPTGLKREALQNKLARFNTDLVNDPEEYFEMIKEAQLLLNGNDTRSNTSTVNNPYSSTPPSRMIPHKVVEDKLSPKERKLVERGSATEEQILKLKAKNPSYLASLLATVRD